MKPPPGASRALAAMRFGPPRRARVGTGCGPMLTCSGAAGRTGAHARALPSEGRYSGVGSASLAIQLTLETVVSMLMRLAINSSFD